MKTLPLQRQEESNRVTVDCAEGEVSVYTHCAYCKHCAGVVVRRRMMPSPVPQALRDIRRGSAPDDVMLNAAMMFNTLIRDGNAIECTDDINEGFRSLYAP
ncbi:MAG: hypothetical protein LUQ40_03420 [Methanomicrobiales archaeon]|nr:hypothetical protein [Methanomicrobiales archaeon]